MKSANGFILEIKMIQKMISWFKRKKEVKEELKEENNGLHKFCFGNKVVYYDDNVKKQGVAITYYPNGLIKNRVHFKDDKLNGAAEWFGINGNLERKHNYKDDKLHGEVKSYYVNGNVKMEDIYIDNEVEGVSKCYYENGDLMGESTYVKGNLKATRLYLNGKLLIERS